MRIRKSHRVLVAVAAVGLVVAGAGSAAASPSHSAGGASQDGYNAIPSKVSGNVASEGFEANSTSELGDEVGLGGTARHLSSMSVLLSSWGCQSGHWNTGNCTTTPGATFDVPLTFTVYADNAGTAGTVLATQTQTVAVAYRPSASTNCTDGRWYNTKDRTCYNGLPQTVTMTFAGQELPDQVIWSVSFNTTHSGYNPISESATCFGSAGGCGYDSLNVGAYSFPKAPFSGTDTDSDQVFRNGSLEGGWIGYRPLGALVTR